MSEKMNKLTQGGKTRRYTLYFAQRDTFLRKKIPCISTSRQSLQCGPTHRLNLKSSEIKSLNFVIYFFLNLSLNLIFSWNGNWNILYTDKKPTLQMSIFIILILIYYINLY